MDYYESMKLLPRWAAVLALVAAATAAPAQPAGDAPAAAADTPPPENSQIDAQLFYQLLLGELNTRAGEVEAGFAITLDAARKTHDEKLYQRATDIALQARSGEAALQAARAWKQDVPASREANRYVLQILIALNRVGETGEPLRAEMSMVPLSERSLAISAIPRLYTRTSDTRLAASVVEQALSDAMTNPATGPAAWVTVGRMRLRAGDTAGALDAAQRGYELEPSAEGPALLALELMDAKAPQAEKIVKGFLASKPVPEVRMAYVRALLESQRYAEALQQVRIITAEKPDLAEAWLVQGTLLAQDNKIPAAETALQRYVTLVQSQPQPEERSRGMTQAYLTLSQLAERRKDFAAAESWLGKIENPQELTSVQSRRASILARQGKLEEARALLRNLPERTPADARMKLMAEVQLLRDNKQYQSAYDLLGQAYAKDPKDSELLYDQAMLAEKSGNFAEMERLLRQLMADKPDYHQAYNALGYSFADRNERLAEAKDLIKKALEYAPDDPFINDSLGWVEFRLGNKDEALRILEAAYKSRPDAEIGAHLGEVLWSLGQRDRALAVWKEAAQIDDGSEGLQETLKRLRVKL